VPELSTAQATPLAQITRSIPARPAVQERLTKQIAAVLMEVLQPTGCGVIVEAK
jgi:GTP cyclohydrolase I